MVPDETFLRWFRALEERHFSELTFSEVRRGVQALSATYVEGRRRDRLGSALSGAGKRAAFAVFYAPLHFLAVQAILRELASEAADVGQVVDLGCGTGVAGAAWALERRVPPDLIGIERNAWAAGETRWSWKTLRVGGTVLGRELDGFPLPGRSAGIVIAYTANELGDEVRPRVRDALVSAAQRGAAVLVVEPIAGSLTPWWDDWAARFESLGGTQQKWRFRTCLPERLRLMDRASGLDHQILTARSLWWRGTPGGG